ncbi:Protein transport protein sec20 [Collariella sp. IMI 366227]|nr:Protein transport protein sec20 [Collariella sp. IMI 366227]
MASFESLQERLAVLQETTTQLRELIDRLANIDFQPGSVPLSTSDEDNVATELSTEISQILRDEEEDLELLQEEIIDLRSGRPGSDAEHRKTRLKEGAARLDSDLKACRTTFRKAQLSARRSLEAAQKLEHILLLASYAASAAPPKPPPSSQAPPTTPAPPPQPTPTLTPLKPNSGGSPRPPLFRRPLPPPPPPPQKDLLPILRELSKSAFASQTLAESTAALAELQRSYEGLDGLLNRSRDLVGTLVRAQKSDTWYLQMAFRMLLVTLGWMVEDTLDLREEEEANWTAEEDLKDKPNPMKRMWEDEGVAGEARDEL